MEQKREMGYKTIPFRRLKGTKLKILFHPTSMVVYLYEISCCENLEFHKIALLNEILRSISTFINQSMDI